MSSLKKIETLLGFEMNKRKFKEDVKKRLRTLEEVEDNSFNKYFFEPKGSDHEEVARRSFNNIWTVLQSEDKFLVKNGYQKPKDSESLVGFLISKKPYNGRDIVLKTKDFEQHSKSV